MATQITIFDVNLSLDDTLHHIIEEMTKELDITKGTLFINDNISSKGKNKGKITSRSISLKEEAYPKGSGLSRIMSVLRFEETTHIELMIRKDIYKTLFSQEDFTIKSQSSDLLYTHVLFQSGDPKMEDVIKQVIRYTYDHYESTSSFGCCALYKQCSEEKHCLHKNKLYATGCMYKKNLDQGKIFY